MPKQRSKANLVSVRRGLITMWSMVVKNIKNQYRPSVLGILWTVLNPLLTMLVMAFVFSSIFGRGKINMDYPVYVLTGNIVFNLLRTATDQALPSMVNNYDLLTKTRVPYAVFPASAVASALVNFGFSLVALIVVMLIRIPKGVTFHWTMPMLLVPWLPAMLMFCLGLAFFLCTIYVRFRDIKHLYTVFLTLWMYMTPVFYSTSILSDKVQAVLKFNPMVHYLGYFRDVVSGTVPSWQTHLIIYGVGLGALGIGYLVFRLSRRKFILYI